MKYIELFAGCGGLSLGLKSVGFNLSFANELSPVASTTYASNLIKKSLKTSLQSIEHCNAKKINKNTIFHGDIHILLDKIKTNNFNNQLLQNIDLIAGGPPCQGFSMAGLRRETARKNQLPYAFLELAELVKPKSILIENVTGILHAFKNEGGMTQTYKEILKAMSKIGYFSICIKVNSEDFGIAEHRPRVLFIGFREDIVNQKQSKYHEVIYKEFLHPRCSDQENPPQYKDLTNSEVKYFLQKPKFKYSNTSKDAIDDLSNSETSESNYVEHINKVLGKHICQFQKNKYDNHEKRTHNQTTTRRFWLKQILAKDQYLNTIINQYLQSKITKLSHDDLSKLEKLLLDNNFSSIGENLISVLNQLKSKKHSQKVLNPMKPSHTILTIPDDVVHYNTEENRVLTVREEARIQSFPDHFIFHGKPTTGGYQREMETPQYTQVGNAVPPLLGHYVGKYIKKVLKVK
jgi:DNA (cytosine-5)-methyltransferase 1